MRNHVNIFMNVKIAKQSLNLEIATVVFSAPMEQFLVRQFRKERTFVNELFLLQRF
jgi:hypothetical protein